MHEGYFKVVTFYPSLDTFYFQCAIVLFIIVSLYILLTALGQKKVLSVKSRIGVAIARATTMGTSTLDHKFNTIQFNSMGEMETFHQADL